MEPNQSQASSNRYKRYYSLLSPIVTTEKARAYTMFTLSLLALSFFGFFAISPTLTTIAELRKKVDDAQVVDTKLQNKITNLSQLQKAYPEVEGNIPIIYDTLPPQARAANLLGKINALTVRYHIALTNLQVQQVPLSGAKTTDALPFTFALSGNGTYEEIYAFLKSLTGFDRLVTIETFSISKTAGNLPAVGQNLSFSLRGTAYILFQNNK